MKTHVFIARSLDGYISDRKGGLDWLQMIPNPKNLDLGYGEFISGVDAIVMGRNTFEVVCGFDIPWPYTLPVYVLSRSLDSIPEAYRKKATLLRGEPEDILGKLQQKGHRNIYLDGGKTIQVFLGKDLVDELIISTLPVLLGGGAPLFGDLPSPLEYEHISSTVLLDAITQDHYRRKRPEAAHE
jgi:dihydrofolate reductase